MSTPWTNPFDAAGRWYKGNLHGHTTESDGAFSPEEYAAFYRGHGYDFAAVTDHRKRTDMSAFADERFAFVPGTEIDGTDPVSGLHHVLGIGIARMPSMDCASALQSTVDAIAACGGLAFIAHPYWSAQTSAGLLHATGYAGIEVYNATCAQRWGKGLAAVQWDELLGAGRLITALATDDAHHRVDQGDDVGLGWVQVRAAALTAEAIVAALRAGHFYASTGPELTDLRVEPDAETASGAGPVLHLRCSPCRMVHIICNGPLGRTIHASAGTPLTAARIRLHRAATYVRVEAVDEQGRTAWSQPVPLRA